ncbi:hypothetical protein ABPG75_012597 [Micractinium tetrahymenae]
MAERAEALQQLQEQLLQLKQQVPALSLSKSSGTPAAPFPIRAAAEVPAAPEAERYDVPGFRLAVQLQPGVLGAAEPGCSGGEQLLDAVAVEVLSAELPAKLRQAVAAELKRLWAASGPAPGALNLPLLWAQASHCFLHLITLLPEALEAYECEDAQGSTVRRWAVLSDEATVTVDASVAPKPAATAPGSVPGTVAGQAAASPAGSATGSRQAQAQQAQRGQPQPAEPPGGLPGALQQELAFLGRRYGLRQLPPADAAAAQLASLHLSPGSAAEAAGAAAVGGGAARAGQVPAPAVAFELALQPTDPAWEPGSHPPQLLLQGWAGATYPRPGSLVLAVSPQQPQLGQLPREVLDKLLAEEVSAALAAGGGGLRAAAALGAVVRHVANHAGQLWEQAEDIVAEVARRRRPQAGQQGQQQGRGAQQAQQTQQQWPACGSAGSAASSELDDDGAFAGGSDFDSISDGSSGSGTEEQEEGEEEEGSEREPDGPGGRAGGGSSGRGAGHSEATLPLQLQLEGLELVDCDCLELLRLNVQVSCGRCRASGELSFASAAVALSSDAPAGSAGGGTIGRRGTLAAAGECPACHAAWLVELAPKLVHERSNMLAQLRAEGCSPLDMLPSMLAGQCGQCASSAAFRSAAVGRWNERACSSCHTPMRFQFSTALFAATQPGGRGSGSAMGAGPGSTAGAARQRRQGGVAAAAAAAPFNGLLQLGQALPDRGTCRHYKHSYRWLRFPCCGKRFPCDLCHEELTDGHDMKWATRMVCGYCSLEQPVAGQCKGCDKKLAATAAAPAGRQTRFWEGGKGQRDPGKLHPNDPRRYRGRSKTQSAKHKRVGQKGKEKREQA